MAQVETQKYLTLLEESHELATFDIEATGLNGDYNSILCVSIKPYGKPVESFAVSKPGNDKEVVAAAIDRLSQFQCWLSYYGKGFDVPMLRTRALIHRIAQPPKAHHIDLYYVLRYTTNTSRRSLGHIVEWLGLPEDKMSVSADVWVKVLTHPEQHMPRMVKRCESDVRILEKAYTETRHLIRDVHA